MLTNPFNSNLISHIARPALSRKIFHPLVSFIVVIALFIEPLPGIPFAAASSSISLTARTFTFEQQALIQPLREFAFPHGFTFTGTLAQWRRTGHLLRRAIARIPGAGGNAGAALDDEPFYPPTLKSQVQAAISFFKLSSYDGAYIQQMAAQYRRPDDPDQQLQIVTPTTPKANYRLAAKMDPVDRKETMGETKLTTIRENPRHLARARRFKFTWALLHGGVGENVGRIVWLANRQGKTVSEVHLGAKGTDLGYDVMVGDGRVFFVSVAELQLLRALDYVAPDQPIVGALAFEPIVNEASAPSFITLLDTEFLDDRISGAPAARTYRQVMHERYLELDERAGKYGFLWQAFLPGIKVPQEYVNDFGGRRRNTEGEIPVDSNAYMQGGGHGQMGVYFVLKAKEQAPEADEFDGHFRVFGNGDNANAQLYPEAADYMKEHGIVVMQVNTKATFADRKGGKVGVRRAGIRRTGSQFIRSLRLDGGLRRFMNGTWPEIWIPDMMELGQAKAADRILGGEGQQEAFYEAGQHDGDDQPFNTNAYVIDRDSLHRLVVEISRAVGDDEFLRIIAPTLVHKPAKKGVDKTGLYVPIDGTIGSVMHNINAWLMTDPRGMEIMDRLQLSRFLAYLDAPRDGFVPVKSVWDQYMQAHTDAYWVDLARRAIVAETDFQFPEVEITSLDANGADDGYWSEYQTMIDSFGRLHIADLKGFYVKGQVKLVDATLKGVVSIENHTRHLVDLHEGRYHARLEQAGILQHGDLIIENKSIRIFEDHLTIDSVTPKRDAALNRSPGYFFIPEALRRAV